MQLSEKLNLFPGISGQPSGSGLQETVRRETFPPASCRERRAARVPQRRKQRAERRRFQGSAGSCARALGAKAEARPGRPRGHRNAAAAPFATAPVREGAPRLLPAFFASPSKFPSWTLAPSAAPEGAAVAEGPSQRP